MASVSLLNWPTSTDGGTVDTVRCAAARTIASAIVWPSEWRTRSSRSRPTNPTASGLPIVGHQSLQRLFDGLAVREAGERVGVGRFAERLSRERPRR